MLCLYGSKTARFQPENEIEIENYLPSAENENEIKIEIKTH